MQDDVRGALFQAGLISRESEVITLRNGLDMGEERTRNETGEIMKCEYERVRQLESSALSKLRHSTIKRRLVDHYNDI